VSYYDVLGVEPEATTEEIKAAYRRLAKASHPDSGNPGDVDRFREIQQAYETLSDPDRRRRYDAARTGTGIPVSWTGGFNEPLRPFREVRPYGRPREPAQTVHAQLELSEQEARRGGELLVEVPSEHACTACQGSGWGPFGWCTPCRGQGRYRVYEQIHFRIPIGVESGEILTTRRSNGTPVRAAVRIVRGP
jgi:DnaJ-class molecular chaperone